MTTIVHGFDWPDRFVVGTVGRPGERTFFLQAKEPGRLVSVSLEKQQSALLADRIDEILDEIRANEGERSSIPANAPDELADHAPLDQPVDERFRVGVMGLGWDPATRQIVIEAFPLVDDGPEPTGIDDVQEPAEALVVRIPVGSARAFAERAREVVAAGRPTCPLCLNPIDTGTEHVCDLDELR